MTDVRSDDEETEGEIEGKRGEGVDLSMPGGTTKTLEGPRENGVKAANGKAMEPHDSYADAVIEGKKER